MEIPKLRLDHKGNKGHVFGAEAWEAEMETCKPDLICRVKI